MMRTQLKAVYLRVEIVSLLGFLIAFMWGDNLSTWQKVILSILCSLSFTIKRETNGKH